MDGSLPGDVGEERVGFPSTSHAPHGILVQGTCQHFPPCQDGSVEEGYAFLAW